MIELIELNGNRFRNRKIELIWINIGKKINRNSF